MWERIHKWGFFRKGTTVARKLLPNVDEVHELFVAPLSYMWRHNLPEGVTMSVDGVRVPVNSDQGGIRNAESSNNDSSNSSSYRSRMRRRTKSLRVCSRVMTNKTPQRAAARKGVGTTRILPAMRPGGRRKRGSNAGACEQVPKKL